MAGWYQSIQEFSERIELVEYNPVVSVKSQENFRAMSLSNERKSPQKTSKNWDAERRGRIWTPLASLTERTEEKPRSLRNAYARRRTIELLEVWPEWLLMRVISVNLDDELGEITEYSLVGGLNAKRECVGLCNGVRPRPQADSACVLIRWRRCRVLQMWGMQMSTVSE